MEKRKIVRNVILSLLCLTLLLGVYAVPKTMAYLTDTGGTKVNKFTVGNVVVDVVEEFDAPSSMTVGTNTFRKKVQLRNNGTVSAYLRANLLFSSGDVEKISKVSGDNGNTWWTLSDFRNHLPNGWVYVSTGVLSGYYYYTQPVAPGSQTPSLITNVRTVFEEKTADTNESINRTPRDYDIFVYAEGVQARPLDGSNSNQSYTTAWNLFLGKK